MPTFPFRSHLHAALCAVLALLTSAVHAAPPGAGERFRDAQPALLQIRSLVASTGKQSSIGSGFRVDASGLAMTNYHVVSEYVLEPETYRLEYAGTDGSAGKLHLVALDVANDLAVVRVDPAPTGATALAFAPAAPTQGQRVYSMGDPLDIGFTIVEGTYNGPVERSYNERIHYTGAINPGMSGGPAVNEEGRVVGVNVAKRLDGELVSFLVPGRFAAALLDRARKQALKNDADAKAELGRQLVQRQTALYEALDRHGFRSVEAGAYRAPESAAPWFQCWANTNATKQPPPRARSDHSSCSADTDLFIDGSLDTGAIALEHKALASIDLNAFQFAHFVDNAFRPGAYLSPLERKHKTAPRCHDDFVRLKGESQPLVRAVWCAQAYREFAGLYDLSLSTVTQDRNREALVTSLELQGVPYELGLRIGRHYLQALGRKP